MNIHEYRCGGAIIAARHGEQCATKLTEVSAAEIAKRRAVAKKLTTEALALSNAALADKFGISAKAIGRILNGKRWATKTKKKYRGMTADDARLIREAGRERDRLRSIAAKHSIEALSDEFGVSKSLIYQISAGSRWVRLWGCA